MPLLIYKYTPYIINRPLLTFILCVTKNVMCVYCQKSRPYVDKFIEIRFVDVYIAGCCNNKSELNSVEHKIILGNLFIQVFLVEMNLVNNFVVRSYEISNHSSFILFYWLRKDALRFNWLSV